jgi:hypothetical protein
MKQVVLNCKDIPGFKEALVALNDPMITSIFCSTGMKTITDDFDTILILKNKFKMYGEMLEKTEDTWIKPLRQCIRKYCRDIISAEDNVFIFFTDKEVPDEIELIHTSIHNFIQQEVPIMSIAPKYIQLTESGRYFTGPSPFVKGDENSLTISPAKNIFYCFSSGRGGDAISLVQAIHNISLVDTTKKLIRDIDIDITKAFK